MNFVLIKRESLDDLLVTNIPGNRITIMDESPESITAEAESILAESAKPKISLLEQIGHFSTAEQAGDLIVDSSQTKITPIQRSIVALCVRGFSLAAACRKLHTNYAAAFRWKNSDWWPVVEEEERSKWLQSEGIDTKHEAFAPLIAPALEAIRMSLLSEDDKVRLTAANLVFDQFFDKEKRPVGRPRKDKEEVDGPPDLSDLRVLAEQRIAEMNAAVRIAGTFNVVSNG
jgi:hypothetical protein